MLVSLIESIFRIKRRPVTRHATTKGKALFVKKRQENIKTTMAQDAMP